MAKPSISTHQGSTMSAHLDALARLRMRVFRDYPYLYEGDLDYEAAYLSRYAQNAASLFVLAEDNGHLVGAATGQPLSDEVDAFRQPFEAAGMDTGQIFYYGESVLLHAYRGQGVGKAFMAEREAHARSAGFAYAAFCAVERPADHPMTPADYQPLHGFWESQGYHRQARLATHFAWRDVGDTQESDKRLVFWLKALG